MLHWPYICMPVAPSRVHPDFWTPFLEGIQNTAALEPQLSRVAHKPSMGLSPGRPQHALSARSTQPDPDATEHGFTATGPMGQDRPTCDLGQCEQGKVLWPVLHRPCDGGVDGPVVGVVMHSPGTCHSPTCFHGVHAPGGVHARANPMRFRQLSALRQSLHASVGCPHPVWEVARLHADVLNASGLEPAG